MDNNIGDEEFRKEVWKGQIPIRFELTANEVTTLQPPSEYYVSFIKRKRIGISCP